MTDPNKHACEPHGLKWLDMDSCLRPDMLFDDRDALRDRVVVLELLLNHCGCIRCGEWAEDCICDTPATAPASTEQDEP